MNCLDPTATPSVSDCRGFGQAPERSHLVFLSQKFGCCLTEQEDLYCLQEEILRQLTGQQIEKHALQQVATPLRSTCLVAYVSTHTLLDWLLVVRQIPLPNP